MPVLLAVLAGLATAHSATPVALETTLCAMVERPQAFSGKLVRFRAGVLTDWQHTTVLVHSGCKRGVELSSTDAVPSEESEALNKAVGTPLDGADRTAIATFTGRFWLRTGSPQHAFDNPFKFEADRIERINVYRRKLNR